MRSSIWAITVFQCVSLVTCGWIVFGIGTSPWGLLLHVLSTIWYVIISQLFLKM